MTAGPRRPPGLPRFLLFGFLFFFLLPGNSGTYGDGLPGSGQLAAAAGLAEQEGAGSSAAAPPDLSVADTPTPSPVDRSLVDPPATAQPPCTATAAAWIAAAPVSAEVRPMLQRHCEGNCRFSGRWVEEYAAEENPERRRRLCTDLVLVWTYKKCVYFRDYVDPVTYDPCMVWVRTMFARCLAGDAGWFTGRVALPEISLTLPTCAACLQ